MGIRGSITTRQLDMTTDIRLAGTPLTALPDHKGLTPLDYEINELEVDLMDVADRLNPIALKALHYWMAGHPKGEAALLAGYPSQTYEEALQCFNRDLKGNIDAKRYLDLNKRIATLRASRELAFDEIKWMQEMLDILNTAKGNAEQEMATFVNGELVSGRGKATQLNNALKAMELIARRHGWLTDKKEVENKNSEATVVIKDFTGGIKVSNQDDDED